MSHAAHLLRVLRSRLAGAILGGFMPLLIAAPALAQTVGTTHEVTGVAGYGAWDWIGLTFRMGAVLVVIWGSVMAMRWYVRRMNGEAGGSVIRALQIVETRPLGPGRALHLVRIGDRAVLIGATPERINALIEIDDPAELERIFAGGNEPNRRGVPGLIAGLAMLPSLAAKANTAMRAASSSDLAMNMTASTEAAPRSTRSVGVLTGLLTRLGRRMHGNSAPIAMQAPPPMATGMFGAMLPALPPLRTKPRPEPRVSPALAAFDAALNEAAPRGRESLFGRTLAEAQRSEHGNVPMYAPFDDLPAFNSREPGLSAAGMRARSSYTRAAPADEELTRETRIAELQRAIMNARRIAG